MLRLIAETLIEGAARDPASASASAAVPSDRLSLSFDALTAAPLQHLLQTIEQRLFPVAAQVQDVSQPAVTQAKDDALKSVDRAAQAIQTGVGIHGAHIPENLDPAIVLALATRMIETHQYPNYLRATELSNTVVTWFEGPIPGVPLSPPVRIQRVNEIRAPRTESKWPAAVAKLWRRAPLLVMLGGWLLLGIAVVIINSRPVFTIWALGFPALIVLQFLLTTRGFRK
ncbi:MAG TPA: hypothetical protein VHA14_14810 [Bryobacteraceae bacterium]|nr:hypothetical protein [Bryobacteraceae bacterium]